MSDDENEYPAEYDNVSDQDDESENKGEYVAGGGSFMSNLTNRAKGPPFNIKNVSTLKFLEEFPIQKNVNLAMLLYVRGQVRQPPANCSPYDPIRYKRLLEYVTKRDSTDIIF